MYKRQTHVARLLGDERALDPRRRGVGLQALGVGGAAQRGAVAAVAGGRLAVAQRDGAGQGDGHGRQGGHRKGAAAPWVQRALVAEQAGDVGSARAAIRRAVRLEPANWRPWLIRARIEALAGDGRSAVLAYRRARDLNPRSAIFAR